MAIKFVAVLRLSPIVILDFSALKLRRQLGLEERFKIEVAELFKEKIAVEVSEEFAEKQSKDAYLSQRREENRLAGTFTEVLYLHKKIRVDSIAIQAGDLVDKGTLGEVKFNPKLPALRFEALFEAAYPDVNEE